jgi:hypothetical protein
MIAADWRNNYYLSILKSDSPYAILSIENLSWINSEMNLGPSIIQRLS